MATKTLSKLDREIHRNWGLWDGRYDIENRRRNREYIQQGELFCLPKWDTAYCEGYRAAMAERN